MKHLFTLLLLCICCPLLQAQHPLKGRVIDADRHPVAEALVSILQTDSVRLLTSVRTDSAGVFVVNGVPDCFLLDVAAFGYDGYTRQLAASDWQGKEIGVTLSFVKLDEVTVTAAGRPRMAREGRKVLIDKLDNSPHAAGNNMYSFMRFIPQLEVPMFSGNIQVREAMGTPAVLLVNGKHINMPMDAYLKNVPVENIESIEVVARSAGEYKVAPGTPVINLIVKKRPDEGFRYYLSLNDVQYDRNTQRGVFSVSYAKNKTYITTGIHLNNVNEKRTTDYEYTYYNADRQTLESFTTKEHNLIGGGYFNLDYELNKKHTFGIQVGAGGMDTDCSLTGTSRYLKRSTAELDSAYENRNRTTNPSKFVDMYTNLNYTFKTDDKGSVFYADFDYRMRRPRSRTTNAFNRIDGGESGRYQDVLQESENDIDAWGVWLRYVHRFNPKAQLVSSLSYYHADSRNVYRYSNLKDGVYVVDTDLSNRFEYKDHTYTGSFSFDHSPSSKFSYTIGATMEGYIADGEKTGTIELVHTNQFNVSPNLSMNFNPNMNHYLSLYTSYRVTQPRYGSFNLNRNYLSLTTYQTGNPDMKETRMLDVSIMYNFFKDYSLYLSSFYMKNAGNDFVQLDENGNVVMLPDQRDCYSFRTSFSYNKSFFKDYLDFNFDAGYEYGVNNDNGGKFIKTKTHAYDVGVNGDVTLSRKKRMTLSFSYSYDSKREGVAVSYPESHELSLDFQKRFDYSNFSIGVSRALRKNDIRYYDQSYFSYISRCKKYWMVTASYSITFGNKRTRGVQQRDNSELRSRMSE